MYRSAPMLAALALLSPAAFAQDALSNGRALDGGLLAAPGGRFNQTVRPAGTFISPRISNGLPGGISGLDLASRELSFSTSPLRRQELLNQRAAEGGLIFSGASSVRPWEQAALRNAGFVPSGLSSSSEASRLAAGLPNRSNPATSAAPFGSSLDDIPQPGEALLARPSQLDLARPSPSTFRSSPIDGLRRLDGSDRPETLPVQDATGPSSQARLPMPTSQAGTRALTSRLGDPLSNQASQATTPSGAPVTRLSPLLTRPGAAPLTPSQERALLQNLRRSPAIPVTYGEQREDLYAPRATSTQTSASSNPQSSLLPGSLSRDGTPPRQPTIDELRDGSRPLSARIDLRDTSALENNRVKQPDLLGLAPGFDALALPSATTPASTTTAVTTTLTPPPPLEPLQLRPVAGRRGLELASEAMAAGKFVSAESLFAAESWKDTRDFTAVLGQVHAAAAAGMLSSTGLMLADAYTREERLIGYPIEPALMMPASRVEEIALRLQEELARRRDGYAGILLAHLGYVHNQPAWITQGLACVEESSEARLQILAPKLRAGWLK
jgi:hypothetical protein